ncbi:YIP1 family protein [Methanosarcina horonobensis]|uniref:YIP1 family protein n=1 Tax=Methanosarcina horonobensis TaxID=418008 RepID=UPI000A4BF744|nr:Yip1 family protein [Methanosarcina horonobensis]
MFSISGYLKEWFNTTKYILTQPRDFFKEMPTSGSFKEPLNFMIFTIFIASLLSTPIIMLTFADYLSEMDLSCIILVTAGAFVFSLFVMAISVPLNAFTYHILLMICGANGNFKTTLRVFCYYLSASVFILPSIGIMMLILHIAEKNGLEGGLFDIVSIVFLMAVVILFTYYAFYILFVGFSEAHRMSMKRVIFALVGIPLVINIIIAAIPMAMVFSSGFSTEACGQSTENTLPFDHEYTDTSHVESNITASYGSIPVVDGITLLKINGRRHKR